MSVFTPSVPEDASDDPIANRKSKIQNPILWAFYLGISWTWVIGMFLPVLLVRDYGFWAWVIFAIPNCLGAAAMGWTMRTGEQSLRFTQNHAAACRIFSLVTIAFHIFVSIWLLPRLIGPAGWIAPAILVQSAFTPYLKKNWPLGTSVVVWIISVAIAISLGVNGYLSIPSNRDFAIGDAAGLSLVCLLGFIFCPYFDLTFHRARKLATSSGAKVAFGVGFCGVFFSMILFTLCYAAGIQNYSGLAAYLIAGHLSVQMLFTVLVHSESLYHQAEQLEDVGNLRAMLSTALAIGMVAGLLGHFIVTESMQYHGLEIGEVVYRCFMSFYGLICPAYAMLSIPSGKPRWILSGLVILLALPFYWLAFIHHEMSWACAGGGIVLLAGIAIQLSRHFQSRRLR